MGQASIKAALHGVEKEKREPFIHSPDEARDARQTTDASFPDTLLEP
jgi:hypothetical protein